MNILSAMVAVALVAGPVSACAAQNPSKPTPTTNSPPAINAPPIANPAPATNAAPAGQPPADPIPAVPTPAVPASAGPPVTAAPTENAIPPVAPAPTEAAPAGQAVISPPSAGAQPANLPDVSPNYILGPEDAINVNVYNDAKLSGPLVIRPDGKVSLPLVYDITAAGLTPMALGLAITEKLKAFINDPTVTVTVTAVNSKRIFFIGEIGHVGPMALTPGLTLLQAIASAGGLTPYAKTKLYILRGPAGSQQKIDFDYKKALKSGNQQGVTLMPGDTIVVP